MVAGGATGALAIGAGDEWPWYHTGGAPGPASVRAFPIAPSSAPKGELVTKAAGAEQDAADQLSLANVALDGERAAAVWVHDKKGTRSIEAVWIDPKSGKPIGAPIAVATGDLGPPTLLLTGEVLDIVWAARDAPKVPMHLERATWSASDAKPTPRGPIALPSGATSSWAPLARVADRVAIAWAHDGRVWAGFGTDLALAARKAIAVTSEGVTAYGPAWGAAGDHALLAWVESTKKKPSLRAAWCK